MSRDAFAKITPVTPPIVNRSKKPKANNMGVLNLIVPPKAVANQENIFTDVGIAIIIVAAVK
jgi:hypothetical protein